MLVDKIDKIINDIDIKNNLQIKSHGCQLSDISQSIVILIPSTKDIDGLK